MGIKRLRIFAGPNGSGKSTIFNSVKDIVDCGIFVNADVIERILTDTGSLNFNNFGVSVEYDVFSENFKNSTLFLRCQGDALLSNLKLKNNTLHIADRSLMDSYFAAFIAEFIRYNMLNVIEHISIETVMSDTSKLEYIEIAKKMGYKIYLYYISTKWVQINIGRVAERKELKGHDVPEDKIIKRYYGSLNNLYDAVKLSDRAYFFDNSEKDYSFFAEYNDGVIKTHQDNNPAWFNKYLIEKL